MFYKKIVALLTGVLLLPIMSTNQNGLGIDSEKEVAIAQSINEPRVVKEVSRLNNSNREEIEYYENMVLRMQSELAIVNQIQDRKEWFLEYKNLMQKYVGIIDIPTTIYDCFSMEEIYLIQRTIETECYDQSFESKLNVASVIFNRLEGESVYGDTVEEIITKENQFAYWRTDITEDTILAAEYAYQIEDTTNGCIGFRSDIKPMEWYDWQYSFTDVAGHHFYKKAEE